MAPRFAEALVIGISSFASLRHLPHARRAAAVGLGSSGKLPEILSCFDEMHIWLDVRRCLSALPSFRASLPSSMEYHFKSALFVAMPRKPAWRFRCPPVLLWFALTQERGR